MRRPVYILTQVEWDSLTDAARLLAAGIEASKHSAPSLAFDAARALALIDRIQATEVLP